MRIVIVGAGEVGFHIAYSLVREGHDLVIIDRDPERVRYLQSTLDVLAVEGDGCDPELLRHHDVGEASRLFAVTDSDAVNVLSALTARRLGVAQCMTRVSYAFHRKNPLICDDPGIVPIYPEELVARELVALTRVPGASRVHFFEQDRLALVHATPSSNAEHLYQRPLRDLGWPAGWRLVGVARGARTVIPTGNTVLRRGEAIYSVGRTDQLQELTEFLGIEVRPTRRVVIAGAGQVGTRLTRFLLEAGVRVTVIDRNEEHAFALAAQEAGAVVLSGDATDPELLREGEIEDADYFVAATQDDMTNVLSSLLARELGARMVIALYNRQEFLQVMRASRIDLPLSPRVMIAGTILKTVHRREILSLDLVGAGDAEVVDFEVPSSARVLKGPLKDLPFPSSRVGAVVRGDTIHVPGGDFVFEPGDHVLVFTLTERLATLEKLFRER